MNICHFFSCSLYCALCVSGEVVEHTVLRQKYHVYTYIIVQYYVYMNYYYFFNLFIILFIFYNYYCLL